jgi:hypothetical protein
MSTENQNEQGTKTNEDASLPKKFSEIENPTIDDAKSRIAQLESINEQLKVERTEFKTKLTAAEQAKVDLENSKNNEHTTLAQQVEAEKQKSIKLADKLKSKQVDTHLEKALKNVGLTDEVIVTAKALIDANSISYDIEKDAVDTKAIESAIESLKTKHSVLFNVKPILPKTERADGNNSANGDYFSELEKIRVNKGTRAQLDAVKKRFGKL